MYRFRVPESVRQRACDEMTESLPGGGWQILSHVLELQWETGWVFEDQLVARWERARIPPQNSHEFERLLGRLVFDGVLEVRPDSTPSLRVHFADE